MCRRYEVQDAITDSQSDGTRGSNGSRQHETKFVSAQEGYNNECRLRMMLVRAKCERGSLSRHYAFGNTEPDTPSLGRPSVVVHASEILEISPRLRVVPTGSPKHTFF